MDSTNNNINKGRLRIKEVLNEKSLYKILDVENNATQEEIRKGYLKTSRLIHPDKFGNEQEATKAFQKVSAAYETLKNPTLRKQYDLIGELGNSHEANPEEAFSIVLTELLNEMLKGNFEEILETMKILTSSEINSDYQNIFNEVQDYLVIGKKCWTAARDEFKQIYSLQCQLRTLSYFNVFGRLEVALELTKIFLSLPIIIHSAGSANVNGRLLNLLNQLIMALNMSKRGVGSIDNWLKDKWEIIYKLIKNNPPKEKID